MFDKQFDDRNAVVGDLMKCDLSDISREEICAIGDKRLREFLLAALDSPSESLESECPEFQDRGAAYCAHANHVHSELLERDLSGSHSK